MDESALVLRDGPFYRAITDITRAPIAESRDADAAIQAAVDWLGADGGAVALGRGRFELRAPVRLASNVWLRGAGRATRLVVMPENAEGIGVLALAAHGATVSDMTVRPAELGGGAAGVVLDGCGDSAARDLLCAGFGVAGVWLRGSSFLCRVSGCSLAENGRAGLLAEELRVGPFSSYAPSAVSGCVCYGGGAGIELRRAAGVSVTGCTVYQSRGPAYHIHTRSNGASLTASRSYQIGGDAVLIERSDEVSVSGMILCYHGGAGICARDASWGTLAGNQIVDTASPEDGAPPAELRAGIELRGARGYQVSGNTIFNWGVAPPMSHGVWEDAASADNSVVGNSANYFAGDAARCEGRGTLCRDNQGLAERPYNLAPGAALPELQRFRRELTAEFLALHADLGARG